MNLTLALMGLAIHTLIWEKLPDWGNWFNWIIKRLPAPLAYLYNAWHCPYCFGFWIAIVLHCLTGIYTIDALQTMPDLPLGLATPIAIGLDALATAMLIMLGSLLKSAISGPAIKGHQMTMAFRQTMETGKSGDDQ